MASVKPPETGNVPLGKTSIIPFVLFPTLNAIADPFLSLVVSPETLRAYPKT